MVGSGVPVCAKVDVTLRGATSPHNVTSAIESAIGMWKHEKLLKAKVHNGEYNMRFALIMESFTPFFPKRVIKLSEAICPHQ